MTVSVEKIQPKKDERKTDKKSIAFSPSLYIAGAVIIALLMSVLVFFLYVFPQWNRVGQGKEFDQEALRQELRGKEQVHAQLKTLKENFDGIPQDQLETIGVVLPQGEQVPEILNQLETIARASGVNLSSVNVAAIEEIDTRSARQRLQAPAAASRGQAVKTLRIQLDVTAFQYQNFKRFVQNVQSNARIMDIQRISFSADSETHSILLNTYHLPN